MQKRKSALNFSSNFNILSKHIPIKFKLSSLNLISDGSCLQQLACVTLNLNVNFGLHQFSDFI